MAASNKELRCQLRRIDKIIGRQPPGLITV